MTDALQHASGHGRRRCHGIRFARASTVAAAHACDSRRSRSTSFAAEAGRSWEECPSRGDPTRLTRLFLQPKAFGVERGVRWEHG